MRGWAVTSPNARRPAHKHPSHKAPHKAPVRSNDPTIATGQQTQAVFHTRTEKVKSGYEILYSAPLGASTRDFGCRRRAWRSRLAGDVQELGRDHAGRREGWRSGPGGATVSSMSETLSLTIVYEDGGDGWIVASIPEVPGAHSQGHTRAQARENVIDALQTMLTPDEALTEPAGREDREALIFTAQP